MAREKDNEMRVIVASTRKDRTGFKTQIGEADGSVHEQWFKLGQSATGCPEMGDDIIVQYNVSPPGAGYEDRGPTYWCNSWMMARSDATPAAQVPVNPAYEQAAADMDRTNATPPPPVAKEQPIAAQESDEPKKDAFEQKQDATRVSIEKQQALRYAVEFYHNGGAESGDVVKVAWQFYVEFLSAPMPPEAMDKLMADVQDRGPNEGELAPPPEYSG